MRWLRGLVSAHLYPDPVSALLFDLVVVLFAVFLAVFFSHPQLWLGHR